MLRSGDLPAGAGARAVEAVYRNAQSRAQIIEDILDASRIVTGKIRIAPRPITLAPVIRTAVESLRPAVEAKNIRLSTPAESEPRMVYADPGRLQQVVWNLLSNAVKFRPERGSVTVSLECGEGETAIVVADDGAGIPEDFLPYVFDRFRQLDGSTTREHGGLGLGLAIVRHLVELPAAVLAQSGAEVRAETSVRGAPAAHAAWRPDVVVSDIATPEEDGFVLVVALTSYVGIRERTPVLDGGFQMYVPKPVEPAERVAALAALVGESVQ